MLIEFGRAPFESGGNIFDVSVPEWMDRSAKTGLDMFDCALSPNGEGMTPSSACLLTGEPGAGKTTLALQLADSCTGLGNVAFFNTNEESIYQVRRVVRRLGLSNGFIFGHERLLGKTLDVLDDVMNRSENTEKQTFFFCDSLQAIDDGKYRDGYTNQMTAVRVMEAFASRAKQPPYPIIVVIGQVNKSGDEFAGKMRIKHAADIHAHLSFDKEQRSQSWGVRCLDIRKNRFGPAGTATFLSMNERAGLIKAML